MNYEDLDKLRKDLESYLNTLPLDVAGRLVYLNGSTFIVAVHTTSPEKAEEAATKAWENMPQELRSKLQANKLGFAGRML